VWNEPQDGEQDNPVISAALSIGSHAGLIQSELSQRMRGTLPSLNLHQVRTSAASIRRDLAIIERELHIVSDGGPQGADLDKVLTQVELMGTALYNIRQSLHKIRAINES
jgi:hypothetical protein